MVKCKSGQLLTDHKKMKQKNYFKKFYFSTPKASNIFSSGQNLVTEDCSKFTPTNTASQSQLILTK
jgi:hypothetical protein